MSKFAFGSFHPFRNIVKWQRRVPGIVASGLLSALILSWAGCGLYDPTPPLVDEPEEAASTVQEPQPLTIGDVESKVFMVADVAETSQGPNIEVDTLESRNERVQLRTINVAAPHPESLVIEFHLVSEQNFPDNPVAILGRIMRDDEAIGDFEAVLGAEAVRRLAVNPEELPSLYYYFDVLEGLDDIPETMLVVADLDAKLTPTGTEEATLDPASVAVASANRSVLRSNPLRINFLPAPETEVEAPEADDATDAEADDDNDNEGALEPDQEQAE